MGQGENILEIFPTENLSNGICSRDEKEIHVGAFSSELSEGVDSVRRTFSVYINAADSECGVGGSSDDRHEIAVFGRRNGIFLPGLTGGNKNYFVKLKLMSYLAGSNQVTIMNGIKGAAHDTDASTPRGISHQKNRLVVTVGVVSASPFWAVA
ncbi:MAG: hypothetical protein ACJAS7_000975 [Alpinimonas sp.]|jgi:hypothetical protein